MNKAILSLLLAVCVLGMALIMLNERLDHKPLPTTKQDELAGTTLSAPAPIPKAASSAPATPAQIKPVQTTPIAPETPSPSTPATFTPEPAASIAPLKPALPAPPKPEPVAGRKAAQAKKTPDKPTDKPAPAQNRITRFVVFTRNTGATIRLTGSTPVAYTSMNLSNPERLVVDLQGQWDVKAPGVPTNPLVTNIRIGKLSDKTRIVIDLQAKPKSTRFIPSKKSNMLDIRVDQ